MLHWVIVHGNPYLDFEVPAAFGEPITIPVTRLPIPTTAPPWPGTSSSAFLWLAVSLGVFDLGLLTWFIVLLLQFGDRYVFPDAQENLIASLYWLSVPLTLAVVVLAVRLWVRRRGTLGWRIHYTLVVISGIAFVWFQNSWILLAGLPQ